MRVVVLFLLLGVAGGACQRGAGTGLTGISADSADQVLDSMSHNMTTRKGLRSSHVYADTAWVYQRRSVMELKNVRMEQFDSVSGAMISTITGARGIYDMRLQSLDVRGNVIATTPGGKTLKTEHLNYDNSKNLIESDTVFSMSGPDGSTTGKSFTSDPGFKNLRITNGQARAKGTPNAPATARGGG